MRVEYWGRQIGMNTAEIWCTPFGELADQIDTHLIAHGMAKEKPKKNMSIFDAR